MFHRPHTLTIPLKIDATIITITDMCLPCTTCSHYIIRSRALRGMQDTIKKPSALAHWKEAPPKYRKCCGLHIRTVRQFIRYSYRPLRTVYPTSSICLSVDALGFRSARCEVDRVVFAS